MILIYDNLSGIIIIIIIIISWIILFMIINKSLNLNESYYSIEELSKFSS